MTTVGFQPTYPVLYRVYNIVLATVLLVVAMPIILLISLAMLLTQGTSIFYRGERIGQNFSKFQILKFRTLCTKQAEALTKDQTLPANAKILTPLGAFLRDTRLDELPQLLNVIMGDMNICGPRPVRPAIRDVHAKSIPNYDIRFQVRPGLLGPTQACFGHGASKRVRAKMNHYSVVRPVSMRAELSLIFTVIASMIRQLLKAFFKKVAPQWHAMVARKDMYLSLELGGKVLPIQSMDRKTLSMQFDVDHVGDAQILIHLKNGAKRRAGIRLVHTQKPGVFSYAAESDFSSYLIERYALDKVVVSAPVRRVETVESRDVSGPVFASTSTEN